MMMIVQVVVLYYRERLLPDGIELELLVECN